MKPLSKHKIADTRKGFLRPFSCRVLGMTHHVLNVIETLGQGFPVVTGMTMIIYTFDLSL